MISRRRFLAISAAFAVARPAHATAQWRGIAFGAEATITLRGPAEEAEAALADAKAAIEQAESMFSLYRPNSWISRLNASGRAIAPPPVEELLRICDRVHCETNGLFDPTVQALWTAAAKGPLPENAHQRVGWQRVVTGHLVQLGAGQTITLNGIAQGWATDRVAAALAAHGFENALVNIGEFRADAGDWRVGISDPVEGLVRSITLAKGAVATSSPMVDLVNRHPHIFGPSGQRPLWSTVSVEASNATLADALSTALCLAPRSLVKELAATSDDVSAITLVAPNGDLEVLR